jgi:hypothetical protein
MINEQRNRGKYDPQSHKVSNNFGLIVADMFEKNYGATIKKVIVNADMADGKTFVVDDYHWDIILVVDKNRLPKHLQDIIYCDTQSVILAIEVEAKLVKNQYLKAYDDFWPSCFRTVDFGWVKYRDVADPSQYKPDVRRALEIRNVQILHFLCLYWENGITFNNNYYSWMMNFKDLEQQNVSTKTTTRGGPPEKFYMVNTKCDKLLCLNLNNGEPINLI